MRLQKIPPRTAIPDIDIVTALNRRRTFDEADLAAWITL